MTQTYDRFSSHYDRFLAPLERYFLGKRRMEALSHVPTGGKILEIGAGTGANLQFYPKYEHAVASDISFNMLNIAKSKTGDMNLIQADAEHLPFSANHFDAALATLVFCSVASLESALAEVMRILKPGGTFVLLEHVRPDGILGRAFDVIDLVTVAAFEDHFNRRTARAVGEAGFRIVSVKKFYFGVLNLIVCEKS